MIGRPCRHSTRVLLREGRNVPLELSIIPIPNSRLLLHQQPRRAPRHRHSRRREPRGRIRPRGWKLALQHPLRPPRNADDACSGTNGRSRPVGRTAKDDTAPFAGARAYGEHQWRRSQQQLVCGSVCQAVRLQRLVGNLSLLNAQQLEDPPLVLPVCFDARRHIGSDE